MTESDTQNTIISLKKFLTELVVFSLGNVLFTLIWFTYDRQCVFWPKYVMFVWGISLVASACRQGILEHYVTKLFIHTNKEEEHKQENPEAKQKQTRVPLYKYWNKK